MRTDIHRPAVIEPTEYQFVAHDYIGPDCGENWRFLMGERAAFRAHMAETGGKFAGHEHGGTCHVCGATAFYIAKFYHPKTNTYIVTGEDCAAKLDMGDALAFRTFRDKVRAGREAMAGKNKAKRILAEKGLEAAWDIHETEDRTGWKYEETTIADIVGKLVKYGNISERAAEFVKALLKRIPERAALEAARAAEAEAAAPVPVTDERIKVVGEVLTIRPPTGEERFPATKMLVKTEAGYKLWGNRPAALVGTVRGDRVEFEAKVVRSDKDDKFGFWARPTKARLLEKKEAA